MSTDSDDFDIVPGLAHSEEDGVHITAQGIDLKLTPEMFDLAQSKGGVSTETDVARDAIRAVYDHEIDQSFNVTVTVEPISEEERHGIEDGD